MVFHNKLNNGRSSFCQSRMIRLMKVWKIYMVEDKGID